MIEYFFPEDKYWLKEEKNEFFIKRQNLSSILGTKIEDDKIIIRRKTGLDSLNGVNSLEEHKSEIKAYDNIKHFNQLGIKDYLLQEKDIDYHNRQNHSYGTALIGIIYYSAIKPFVKDTIFKKLLNDEKCERILNLALLLHDVGHLPFSHLMEEVFNDVNWIRAKGKYHRHDDAPLEQLNNLEKAGLKKVISKALEDIKSTEIDVNEYFEFLQDLVAGISGVPFLDAIVNSSIDADKIDYIFRDMKYTKATARLGNPKAWVENFLSDISLAPEGLVRLNGESSLLARQLLEERQFLYKTLYLKPEIRVFEKIAATVIISFLTRKVSQLIDIPKTIDNDLRKMKGNEAYKLLIDEFYKFSNELELLINICTRLSSDDFPQQDKRAKEWFGKIRELFIKFEDDSSKGKLKELSSEMIVEEPIYFDRDETGELRKIARDLYVDYPCWVLIDIVKSPKFLPTPRSRRFKTQYREFICEQFLVPDEDINKWKKKSIARIPLHLCNFTSLEQKFAQVLVINTFPGERRGEYIYDLFLERCRARGIEPISSAWR